MAQPLMAERLYTPEELEAMPDAAGFELIDGVLRERAVSYESSRSAARIARIIGNFAEAEDLGDVLGADIGLRLWPRTPLHYRRPDVAFVQRDHVTADVAASGMMTIPPDLVVEVISPNDLGEDIGDKIAEYVEAGVPLIWVAYTRQRAIQVIRADRSGQWFRPGDTITGEDVLPGFEHRVGDLFPAVQPVALREEAPS
jgi:Uma2 family endonuclease